MALLNFTDQKIQDTYQRVVQTDGTKVFDGTGSLLPIEFNENNVIISGTLIAQSYIVSESITNVSSGSTIFGNSLDDTHQITGSLIASGSITAPTIVATTTFAGSLVGTATGLSGTPLISVNQITASGDLLFTNEGTANITTNENLTINLENTNNGSDTVFKIHNLTTEKDIYQLTEAGIMFLGPDTGDAALASHGNLTFTIDTNNNDTNKSFFFKNYTTTLAELHESEGFNINTNITASGNVSASGDLIVNNINGNIDGGTF